MMRFPGLLGSNSSNALRESIGLLKASETVSSSAYKPPPHNFHDMLQPG